MNKRAVLCGVFSLSLAIVSGVPCFGQSGPRTRGTPNSGQGGTQYRVHTTNPNGVGWQNAGDYHSLAAAQTGVASAQSQGYGTFVGTVKKGRVELPPIVNRPKPTPVQPAPAATGYSHYPNYGNVGVSQQFLVGGPSHGIPRNAGQTPAPATVTQFAPHQPPFDADFFDRLNHQEYDPSPTYRHAR